MSITGGRIAGLFACVVLALGAAAGGDAAGASFHAFSWGDGYLGNGANELTDFPAPINGLGEVTALAGGEQYSLALLSNGSVDAWGVNKEGQLGNGTTANRGVPLPVTGLSAVTAIAASGGHSLALLSDGTVEAWGANREGQLGNGTTTNSDVPVAVTGLSGVTAIGAGTQASYAVLSDGAMMAWGANEWGQLGNGTTTASHVPIAVSGLSEAKAVAAGATFALALLRNGEVRSWGLNLAGQLGNGTKVEQHTPGPVSNLHEVTAIAAAEGHSLALLAGGTVDAWGENSFGELGDGTFQTKTSPVAVHELAEATAVAAGGLHSFALLRAGTVKAWGGDELGELGNGEKGKELFFNVPVAASCGLSEVAGIASGEFIGLAFGSGEPSCVDVTALRPDEGSPGGGTAVTITGTGFTGASGVSFGSAEASSFKVESASQIKAVSPPGVETVDVTVSTPTGTSPVHAIDRFTYSATPTVTSISPVEGTEGTHLSIRGTNFGNLTAVNFGSVPVAIRQEEDVSSHELTVTVPVAPPGIGTVDVTVTNPSGTSEATPADRFTFLQPPEFGRCVEHGVGKDKFVRHCSSTIGGVGGFEWYPGFSGPKPIEKRKFTTALHSKTLVFKTTGGKAIICTTESGAGELTGARNVTLGALKFTGCRLRTASCESAGAIEGEVQTSPLSGELGRPPVGLELSPAIGETVAEFSCAGVSVTITGSVILQMPTFQMSTTAVWKGLQTKGIQRPTHFEAGPEAVLHVKIGATAGFEQAGLEGTILQTGEEQIEISNLL